MTHGSSAGRIDWWKRLADHLHVSTAWQLKRLEIRSTADRVIVKAVAPSQRVCDIARRAAEEIVPGELLQLAIHIDDQPESESPLRARMAQQHSSYSGSIPAVCRHRQFLNVLSGK